MKILIFALLYTSSIFCKLPGYNVDINKSTISGLSSGGAFVQQFTTTFSSIIQASATIAGIPFGCAEGAMTTALTSCMNNPFGIDAQTLATKNLIDPLSGVAKQKQWFYSGVLDTVVKPGVVKKAEQLAQSFGASTSNEYTIVSEHTWPTSTYGNPCIQLGTPYISKCNYEASQKFMQLFLGDQYKQPGQMVSSNLIQFDQSDYKSSGDSMNSIGYVYVPTACGKGDACTLHVAFHGCSQTVADVGDAFVKNLGLNEIAETNNIIVLYPQAAKSMFNPQNPNGCWDWWGYTSTLLNKLQYLTKDGPQMKAVYRMMQDLSSKTLFEE